MTATAGAAWRSRHDPWKAAFFGVAAAALIAGVAWALLGSSLLVVRSVRVTGSSAIPRATVLAAARIRPGTPLIRIDTAAVARRVEQITQVQSARVMRSWPDAIVIWTKRRTAVFAVPARGGYDLMDRFGVVLGWAPAAPGRLLVLMPPAGPVAALRGNAAVLAAGTIVVNLPAWLRRQVSAVRARGRAAVTLLLRGGATVLWGTPGRTAEKAAEMAILLPTGASYYDVSDPATAVTGRPAGAAG